MSTNEHELELYRHEGTTMEQLMAHLNDEKFARHLARYHNSQARDGLRDLDLYIQMLIARFDNSTNTKLRVKAHEITIIKTTADDILNHFVVAEAIIHEIVEQHAQLVERATISETEDTLSLGFNDERPTRKTSRGA